MVGIWWSAIYGEDTVQYQGWQGSGTASDIVWYRCRVRFGLMFGAMLDTMGTRCSVRNCGSKMQGQARQDQGAMSDTGGPRCSVRHRGNKVQCQTQGEQGVVSVTVGTRCSVSHGGNKVQCQSRWEQGAVSDTVGTRCNVRHGPRFVPLGGAPVKASATM